MRSVRCRDEGLNPHATMVASPTVAKTGVSKKRYNSAVKKALQALENQRLLCQYFQLERDLLAAREQVCAGGPVVLMGVSADGCCDWMGAAVPRPGQASHQCRVPSPPAHMTALTQCTTCTTSTVILTATP